MADLIAQGPEFSHRWRRELPRAKPITIGRIAGAWSVPWDDCISRQHVEVEWNGTTLTVRPLPKARNPVFFRGQAAATFSLKPGEHFVIGETMFTLSADKVQVTLDSPRPAREQSFSASDLRSIAFRNAQQRIEILSRLPNVIEGAASEGELYLRLINLLLSGIPHADAAALVELNPSTGEIHVLHWDRRRLAGGDFQPSQRLIQKAIAQEETVLHTWTVASTTTEFTAAGGIDWAFCTPLPKASKGWGLYVAGRFGFDTSSASSPVDPGDLQDDVKFTEIAASALASLRELRHMQRRQAGFSQFFSPPVLEVLANDDPDEVLAPREADVTVLFCDLRGFSRTSEQSASRLLDLLNRVGKALGVMTRQILDHGGVVGDFHGDAAMGFWGWPLAVAGAALQAALAAIAIRTEFEAAANQPGHPLADFRVGIGIASGRAVAGKIGTTDQVKVTVFGPVVNLAARLESMTRQLGASILLDPATADTLRKTLPPETGCLRRVAVVRPYGFEQSVEVTQLASPDDCDRVLTPDHIAGYESALEKFRRGDWSAAASELRHLSGQDPVVEFLAGYIDRHRDSAPSSWNGVITFDSK